MDSSLRYPGKVVIVTGGTSGIGLATVKEFVHQGANVVFSSKASDAQKGQEIQRALQASGCPGNACFQICDNRKESDIKRLIRITVERYGCLDCLVNNAGDGYKELSDDVTAQDFENLMKLNTLSYLLLSKYALPYLRQTKGNIINMASLFSTIGFKDALSTIVTQGGVIAMTKALAIDESKYGVRVNSISPGNIWTPLWKREANRFKDPKAVVQEGDSQQLMGRMGTPEEVALAILFLAADATFCTGLNLLITGGAEIGFGIKYPTNPETSPIDLGNLKDPPPSICRPTKMVVDKGNEYHCH
ncbi:17-beta-hydroxysteroid dehydrogenase 14-like [Heteronotia binoei]|uniref:17-beta-hydroxysteroid dehydrogenase 14-like n=1 Tax=Heteronotia binoei TaxID=13085 RepID=UPI00292FE48F|nr:17-beta-hydroxysteroid dehydrogenase 14-like [Heteronotia binoei]